MMANGEYSRDVVNDTSEAEYMGQIITEKLLIETEDSDKLRVRFDLHADPDTIGTAPCRLRWRHIFICLLTLFASIILSFAVGIAVYIGAGKWGG